jgi:uncharacterized protein YdhG (YjbR/CyaY superfamily)
MKKSPSTDSLDAYIASFPTQVQDRLSKIRSIICKAAPEATEAIKYQIPTFVLGGNLMHFAAFKQHIGFYPTPSTIEEFKSELQGFKSAKGSIQFPLDQPLPYDLIRRMVRFRVQEKRSQLAHASSKKKRP